MKLLLVAQKSEHAKLLPVGITKQSMRNEIEIAFHCCVGDKSFDIHMHIANPPPPYMYRLSPPAPVLWSPHRSVFRFIELFQKFSVLCRIPLSLIMNTKEYQHWQSHLVAVSCERVLCDGPDSLPQQRGPSLLWNVLFILFIEQISKEHHRAHEHANCHTGLTSGELKLWF